MGTKGTPLMGTAIGPARHRSKDEDRDMDERVWLTVCLPK